MNYNVTLAATLIKEPGADSVTDMIAVRLVDIGKAQAAVVTLARPAQHNALNLAGWRRLERIFEELSGNGQVRVVIIHGSGGRAFGAGADISEFPYKRIGAQAGQEYSRCLAAALEGVQSIPVPVIAMIDGLAVGGGCELAAACDIRIASRGSLFGIPVGKLGVILGLSEMRAVVGAIGAANLKYLVYSGELIDASRAEAWGLVQEVIEQEKLVERTCELALNIVLSAEVTVRATKQLAALVADPSTTNQHNVIERLMLESNGGRDLREGVDAFLAGRTPEFAPGRSIERVST